MQGEKVRNQSKDKSRAKLRRWAAAEDFMHFFTFETSDSADNSRLTIPPMDHAIFLHFLHNGVIISVTSLNKLVHLISSQ
jgi:hypothetical protein